MRIFSSIFSKAQPPAAPAEPELGREALLLADLHQVSRELDTLSTEMARFRRENFACVSARVVMVGADVNAGSRIRSRWNEYLNVLGKLTARKNEILREWSALEAPKKILAQSCPLKVAVNA